MIQTPAERAASAWKLYQTVPYTLAACAIISLSGATAGLATEPGRIRRAFGLHLIVALASLFSIVAFFLRARSGFNSKQKSRPLLTVTPVKTYLAYTTLTVLWGALVAVIVVAWIKQKKDGNGSVIRLAPIVLTISMDVLMIFGWLHAIACLFVGLKDARAANQDEIGS